jgi:ligand-binding sensor domain-containing protein
LEIIKIDINSGIVEQYNSKQEKPTSVYNIFLDESGNVWVLTENGLARFNPDAVEGRKFINPSGGKQLDTHLNSSYF